MSAISNISEPWNGHSNQEVEDFLKEELKSVTTIQVYIQSYDENFKILFISAADNTKLRLNYEGYITSPSPRPVTLRMFSNSNLFPDSFHQLLEYHNRPVSGVLGYAMIGGVLWKVKEQETPSYS